MNTNDTSTDLNFRKTVFLTSKRKLKNMTTVNEKNMNLVMMHMNHFFSKSTGLYCGYCKESKNDEYKPKFEPVDVKCSVHWVFKDGNYPFRMYKNKNDIPLLFLKIKYSNSGIAIYSGAKYKIYGDKLVIINPSDRHNVFDKWIRYNEFHHIDFDIHQKEFHFLNKLILSENEKCFWNMENYDLDEDPERYALRENLIDFITSTNALIMDNYSPNSVITSERKSEVWGSLKVSVDTNLLFSKKSPISYEYITEIECIRTNDINNFTGVLEHILDYQLSNPRDFVNVNNAEDDDIGYYEDYEY